MTELIVGTHESDTHQKALRINLDPRWYGTVAEIGAGQEVVRWFFRVGGAAGTVAKSISAYDMAVSDAVYGKADRYVSAGRLQGMLDKEFQLNVERLDDERGDDNCFFAFADTVVARSYRGSNECHGWMGVKFQAQPHDEPSQIVMHVRMLDIEAFAQQEALGDRRGEPAVRGVLPPPRAGQAHREPARPADHRPHRDRHDRVPRHRVPRRGQPADGAQARAARAQRRGDVRPRPRGAAAERGPAEEGGPGGAGQLPAADAREPRHAGDRAGQVRRGSGGRGQAGADAHRDHHAQPARGRGRRRGPARLPGPRRAARGVRHDGDDQRLLRLLPAGRLHRRADQASGSASSWGCRA